MKIAAFPTISCQPSEETAAPPPANHHQEAAGWSAQDLLEAPPGHVDIGGVAVPLVSE
jgi:hypothetical protein